MDQHGDYCIDPMTEFRLFACAVAAVLGLAGTAIRTYLNRPPSVSPIIDVAVLAILALGLFLYARHTKVDLAKYRYLKKAFV